MEQLMMTIRAHQSARHWTDYMLAERTGIPQSTVSSWFNKNAVPSLPSLEKVCQAFGITLSQLFAGEGDAVILTTDQQKLLSCWSCLTEKQQQVIFQVIALMNE